MSCTTCKSSQNNRCCKKCCSTKSILDELDNELLIGFTIDPINGDANPYGLTIAQAGTGIIKKGDLIVSNFNDSAGVEGNGTTVVGLSPFPIASAYEIAQSDDLLGPSAITSLEDGTMYVTAYVANKVSMITSTGVTGMVSSPFPTDVFYGPWSIISGTHDCVSYLFISDTGLVGGSYVRCGNVFRVRLQGDQPISITTIVTGFGATGVPGTVLGPAGLSYDANKDLLYVVDSINNRVLEFKHASQIVSDGVVIDGSNFEGPNKKWARVVYAGAPLNGPISSALLANGNLAVGNTLDPDGFNLMIEISPCLDKVVSIVNVDTGPAGAIFGIVAVPDGCNKSNIVYFNDDNLNAVIRLASFE